MSETKQGQGMSSTEQTFLERARAEAASNEVKELPPAEEVIGEYCGVEHVEKKRKEKGESDNSPIITIKALDGNKTRYWAFGLLMHLIEKHEVKPGDMLYVKKSAEKSKDGYWGCAFYAEHKGGK